MYPVLAEVFGVPITSYGVSKALAALAAAFLLAREFRRLGWNPDLAATLVLTTAVFGFLGGKLYYLAEHADRLSVHHFGGAGFTWYGGFLAGLVTFVVIVRRHRLPLAAAAAVSAAPLSLAYGIGRLGCLLAGDGTYGRPTDLPWGMTFPNAMMPTTVPVHPTPLYEAIAAFFIAAVLWKARTRWHPYATVGAYAVLTGTARLLVEILRINDEALLGFTQPQLWSLVLIAGGAAALVLATRERGGRSSTPTSDRGARVRDDSEAGEPGTGSAGVDGAPRPVLGGK